MARQQNSHTQFLTAPTHTENNKWNIEGYPIPLSSSYFTPRNDFKTAFWRYHFCIRDIIIKAVSIFNCFNYYKLLRNSTDTEKTANSYYTIIIQIYVTLANKVITQRKPIRQEHEEKHIDMIHTNIAEFIKQCRGDRQHRVIGGGWGCDWKGSVCGVVYFTGDILYWGDKAWWRWREVTDGWNDDCNRKEGNEGKSHDTHVQNTTTKILYTNK